MVEFVFSKLKGGSQSAPALLGLLIYDKYLIRHFHVIIGGLSVYILLLPRRDPAFLVSFPGGPVRSVNCSWDQTLSNQRFRAVSPPSTTIPSTVPIHSSPRLHDFADAI
ncbi:hypothetical protein COLO4_16240 [Corchorus olitorius]|uniref:Uncharacterized protein n=1 Tax=Corchorus olitorius TaxID=93759 RepID=A0A1R3JIP0_9ROSI|nr:hypothetical protein COLO4_16240 [Corchorus olitorius]